MGSFVETETFGYGVTLREIGPLVELEASRLAGLPM